MNGHCGTHHKLSFQNGNTSCQPSSVNISICTGPAQPPAGLSADNAANLLKCQLHHSEILAKIYDVLVRLQHGLVNLQEGQTVAAEALKEVGRVYTAAQLKPGENEVLNSDFPHLAGETRPKLSTCGKTFVPLQRVVDVFDEVFAMQGTLMDIGCGLSADGTEGEGGLDEKEQAEEEVVVAEECQEAEMGVWRCPSEDCEERFNSRKELRQHIW